jgi:hypothetical protein
MSKMTNTESFKELHQKSVELGSIIEKLEETDSWEEVMKKLKEMKIELQKIKIERNL